jgi:transposase
MTTSTMYHTQGIRGYKYEKTERYGRTEIYSVRPTAIRAVCPSCLSWNTTLAQTGKMRDFRGLFIGLKKVIIRVMTRRIVCQDCHKSMQEPISFCGGAYARHTKWLARFVIALRAEMSIRGIARLTGLHWDAVKNIEKEWLAKKYHKVRLNDVEYLGIDEVHLGKKMGYITVVRDMDSGAVLFIGKGKGGDALKDFRKRLRRKRNQIKAVAMDMSNAYSAWVGKVLPESEIVYDHFHVIKLMNERMDNLRRSTMNKLEDDMKKALKGKRYLLLRNEESLPSDAATELAELRLQYKDLGTASMMKEYLRNIYKMATDEKLAEKAFVLWCEKADISGISCLKQMARTIRKRMKGLLAYWRHNKLTNASQEGFNNKIGWLTRQAYGYRDERYLHLKILDLPNLSTARLL